MASSHPSAVTSRPQPGAAAYVALGFGVLCIGLSAIFVKLAGVPGPVSAFYRVFFAVVLLTPWWLLRRRALPSRRVLLATAFGGFFFAADLVLWNSAILLTDAGVATLLANNAPIWVGLAAWLFLHERLTANFWVGLTLSMVGMVLIVGVSGSLFTGSGLGNLMAVGASLLYAAYLLTTQRVRARMDTTTFMMLSMAVGVVLLLPICLAWDLPLTGFSPTTWGALLALGIVSQLGGWLSINYALGHIQATQVSVTLLAQAVVTTLVAIPVLGELPAPVQIVGGVMVLGGIYWVYRGRDRR